MPTTLAQQRTTAAMLLSSRPTDAVASYFALEHDERRTKLFVREDTRGKALAFVAVCQTGIDLFRPLVVVRGEDATAVQDALREALAQGRQYLFSAPINLRNELNEVCHLSGEQTNRVYALAKTDFQPVMNIMVQSSRTPDGQLRAVMKTRDGNNAAEAGSSWISSKYAEVFVNVLEAVRGRGLGKSVVSAVSNELLQRNKTPIYVTDIKNIASQRLAEKLGYQNTGAVELSGALNARA